METFFFAMINTWKHTGLYSSQRSGSWMLVATTSVSRINLHPASSQTPPFAPVSAPCVVKNQVV